MKRTIIFMGLLLATLASGAAIAATPQQACDEKKNAIGNQENKQKDVENQIKDVDNQVDSLKQQIKALEDRKNTKIAEKKNVTDPNRKGDIDNQIKDIDNQIDSVKQQIKALDDRKKTKNDEIVLIKAEIKKMKKEADVLCGNMAKCEIQKKSLPIYQTQVTELKKEADVVKKDVQKKAAEVQKMDLTVKKAQQIYQKLVCDNLVAGETEQAVIDQCNGIYNDWKKDAATMSELNKEVVAVQNNTKKLATKAKKVVTKIGAWNKNIVKYCQGDAVVQEADSLSKTDVKTEDMAKDIDKAKSDLKVVRKVVIAKPVVKKGTTKKVAE